MANCRGKCAFGLKMRHMPKKIVKERTAYYLKKTDLKNSHPFIRKSYLGE